VTGNPERRVPKVGYRWVWVSRSRDHGISPTRLPKPVAVVRAGCRLDRWRIGGTVICEVSESDVQVTWSRSGKYDATLSVRRRSDGSLVGRGRWVNGEVAVQGEGEVDFVVPLRSGQPVERQTFAGFCNLALRVIIERRDLNRGVLQPPQLLVRSPSPHNIVVLGTVPGNTEL